MYYELATYAEWAAMVEDMGYEIVPPYVDVENGPSPDDPYETTIAVDRIAGEEVGLFAPEDGYGILFDNPNDFASWEHEAEVDPENYV